MAPESIRIAPELKGTARLGLLAMEGLRVQESSSGLKAMLDGLAAELALKYKHFSPAEIPPVREVRAIFHRAGLDPTRYRPSSESLLRRAVRGDGVYFINCVVDLVNYLSLKYLWPMGLYDRDRLKLPIELRIGRKGEFYEGIGRGRLHLDHFPLLADQDGPFGSPVSDSVRTRVTPECTRILWITFAPPGAGIPLDEFASEMNRFNEATVQGSIQLEA